MRPESVENAALSWTVILAIVNVPLKLGTVSVELSVPGPVASRGGDDLADAVRREVLRAGDRAGRAHDLEHLARGEACSTCMGRSNVTLSVLVVPSVIRLPLRVAARHRGAENLRAGDDQRQGVLVERRAEDARGAVER